MKYKETIIQDGLVQKGYNWVKKKATALKEKIFGYRRELMIDSDNSAPDQIQEYDNTVFTYLFSSEDVDTRMSNYEKYYNYYKGQHAILEDVDTNRHKDRSKIVVNLCELLIDMFLDILIGKELTTENEVKNIDHNMNYAICKSAAISGDSFVVVYHETDYSTIDDTGNFPKKMKYTIIPSLESYPLYINNELVLFVRKYRWKNLSGVEQEFVDVYDKNEIRHYMSNPLARDLKENFRSSNFYSTTDGLFDYIPNPDKPTEVHNLGRVPVVHFCNVKVLETDNFGQSDLVNIIPLQDCLNDVESDESDVLAYHGFPQMVIKNCTLAGTIEDALEDIYPEANSTTEGVKRLSRLIGGVDKALFIEGETGEVSYLNRNIDTTVFINKKDKVKATMFQLMRVPNVDIFTNAGNVAGITLTMLYKPSLIRARRKAMILSKQFEDLFSLIGEDSGKITFNFNMPINELEKLQEIEKLLAIGLITIDKAIELYPGLEDKEDIIKSLKAQQQEKMKTMGINLGKEKLHSEQLVNELVNQKKFEQQQQMSLTNREQIQEEK